MGDEKVSLKEYTRILLAGISEGLMGFVPPSKDSVLIGDVVRSRFGEVDYVFLLGNNDCFFPKGASAKGILTEAERIKIEEMGVELAPSSDELYAREQFYLYMLLTKPKKGLYVSYAKSEPDGNAKNPSYLIGQIKKIFDGLVTEDDEKDTSVEAALGTDRGKRYLIRGIYDNTDDDIWKELCAYYAVNAKSFFNMLTGKIIPDKRDASLSKKTAEALYGDDLYASVSRLETYMSCPYSHYLSYGLKVKERQRYTTDKSDLGNIFHEGLRILNETLKNDEKNISDLSEDDVIKLSEETLQEAVDGYRDDIFLQDKRTSYIINKVKKIYTDSVRHIISQMRAGEFELKESEVEFPGDIGGDALTYTLDDNRKIRLHGRIDRIDTCEYEDKRLIKIIDYKNSSRNLSLGEVYHGLRLQLFTYLRAAMNMPGDKKNIPAAVLYFAVDETEKNWKKEYDDEEKIKSAISDDFRPTGYVNADPEVYEKLDRALLESGVKSRVVPIKTTKTGAPHKTQSKLMSTKQFDKLLDRTVENIVSCGNAIYNGNICARPARITSVSGCEYCTYEGVCGIEYRTRPSMENKYETLKDSDVWERLGE